jgi:hypothetical protein
MPTVTGFSWRRRQPSPSLNEPLSIMCSDEASARAEAERRQAAERDPDVEWIYLRRDEDRQWIVRRWTPDLVPDPQQRESDTGGRAVRLLIDAVFGAMDPTNWFG